DDIRLAATLTNLAELYRRQGKYPQAGWLLRRALGITKKAKGSHHPQVASIVNNLGTLYATTGRMDAAERMFRRALILRERTLGGWARRMTRSTVCSSVAVRAGLSPCCSNRRSMPAPTRWALRARGACRHSRVGPSSTGRATGRRERPRATAARSPRSLSPSG